jgi:hypothetical protein
MNATRGPPPNNHMPLFDWISACHSPSSGVRQQDTILTASVHYQLARRTTKTISIRPSLTETTFGLRTVADRCLYRALRSSSASFPHQELRTSVYKAFVWIITVLALACSRALCGALTMTQAIIASCWRSNAQMKGCIEICCGMQVDRLCSHRGVS